MTDPVQSAGAPPVAPRPVPMRLKLFNGIGAMAYGIKENGFSTFLLLFYNQVVGLDAKTVSLALMLAMIIDAFADPVIGHLSDRTYSRWGRRLPWLYAAALPLALCWVLLWMPPQNGGMTFLYLLVVAIAVRTLISCTEVPATAVVAELTRDYDERTIVMRYRILFAWIGGLLASFLAYGVFLVPTSAQPVGQLNADGYLAYGIFGAVVMAASILISALGQHRRLAHLPPVRPEPTSLSASFGEIRAALSHRAFMILLVASTFALASQQLTFVISNYLYLFVWRFSQATFAIYPWLLLSSVAAAFVLVPPLARRFGKRQLATAATLFSVTMWVMPFALLFFRLWPAPGSDASNTALFALFFLANASAVMIGMCGLSMITDIVEAAEIDTGKRSEGMFFAGYFFVQKCATGIGILLTGLVVSLSGLPEKAQPGLVAPLVIDRLTIAYCVLIVLFALGSAFAFTRFPINREDHAARLRILAERAAAQ